MEEVGVASAALPAGRGGPEARVPVPAERTQPATPVPTCAALWLRPGPLCPAALCTPRTLQGSRQGHLAVGPGL
jgi:hypothetical protein